MLIMYQLFNHLLIYLVIYLFVYLFIYVFMYLFIIRVFVYLFEFKLNLITEHDGFTLDAMFRLLFIWIYIFY